MGSVKTPFEMITPEEMAPRCGINHETIRMALRKGLFPVGLAIPMGSGRWRYIIPRAEFERWLAGEIPSNVNHTMARFLMARFGLPSEQKKGDTSLWEELAHHLK